MNAMSTPKTDVQKTLIAMRHRLNLTQQQLAVALKVSAVTVGRWESTRSPTGTSLTQLAAFAHEAGDEEGARVFHGAAFPEKIHIEIDFARSEADRMAKAPDAALKQIRENRRNRAVKREYICVLRALLRAHQVLTHQALEGLKGKSNVHVDFGAIADVQQNLRKELNEQQGQKTKTKR
jgi:transcriptional regulator with XRE-family HTH domain